MSDARRRLAVMFRAAILADLRKAIAEAADHEKKPPPSREA